MARVRVFVSTYRRSYLLRRALDSLRAQTLSDWVCEVHNDAPDDLAPGDVVRALADPRLQYVHHAQNMGAVALFNEVFSSQAEPYVALLEDDNWWHPYFLARMVAVLDSNPDVTLGWSNQNIWEESSRGEWSDTGRLVRPASADRTPIRLHWPNPLQCFGALHSNGSLLLRSRPGRSFPTPKMELGGTEAVRERSFPHPLLYVPEPLAVFSVTQTTHRSQVPALWATNQVLLAATFLKHAGVPPDFWRQLWADARRSSPRMTGTLILATLQDPSLRHHRRHAEKGDWWRFILGCVRHPLIFVKLLRARSCSHEMWDFLDVHTEMRAKERSGEAGTPPYSVSFSNP